MAVAELTSSTTTAVPTRRRRRGGVERAKARAGWLLLTPALLHSLLFVALPVVISVVLSFTNARVIGTSRWIGLKNYATLLTEGRFGVAVLHTLLYTVVVTIVAIVISVLVALGLNQPIRGRAAFRTAFYIPVVTSTVAVASIWLWIYDPNSGLGNALLSFIGIKPSGWLTDPGTALMSLMLIGVWQGLGEKIVLYLAALQGVSEELVQSAQLDGAGRWGVFWNVIWPALRPAHFFVLVTSVAGSFQMFDLVYVTTAGGPAGATNVVAFDIYTNAFEKLQIGFASAETVIMVAIVGVLITLGRLSLRED